MRAEGVREERRLLVEAELHASGRDRVQVNRQPLRRSRDLLGAFCVTVFAPDDLALVKGGPQGRRDYLDDLLMSLHPRHDATITEVERVLKQRNALLKSAGGSAGAGRPLPPDVTSTLDVWDAKLAAAGESLVGAREALTAALEPLVRGGLRPVGCRGGPPGASLSAADRTGAAGRVTCAPPWPRLARTTCVEG